MTGALIEVEDLTVRIRTDEGLITAVESTSFRIAPGEVLGLVGESGSGKTTLGRAILMAVPIAGGSGTYDDGDVRYDLNRMTPAEVKDYRRRAQLIFQDPYAALSPRMTVRDIIAEPLEVMGITASRQETDERVREIAAKCRLNLEHLRRFPHAFSGGQRQRISIARALVCSPRFLIADESVAALDVSIQADILNLLKSLQNDLGLTFMFISHDLSVVAHTCDVVSVMYLGTLVETAPTRRLFAAPPLHAGAALRHPVPGSGRSRPRAALERGDSKPDQPPERMPLPPALSPRRAHLRREDAVAGARRRRRPYRRLPPFPGAGGGDRDHVNGVGCGSAVRPPHEVPTSRYCWNNQEFFAIVHLSECLFKSVLPMKANPDAPVGARIESHTHRRHQLVKEEPVAAMPTLAPWTYRNRAFFDLEMDRIFKRHWLLVGHLAEMPEPGDYLTFDVAGERAVIIRGDDGVVRAFHNVCRHRGSCLVDEPRGHCDHLLVCPFHGWAYGRDGTLRGVPARRTFPGFDQTRHGLVPVDLEVWHGFVFIRFGGDGPGVAELTAPLNDEIAHYRLSEVQPLPWSSHALKDVNWKLIHDVDNEGYHVPIGHPALDTLYGEDYRESMVNEFVAASYGTVERDSPYWSVGLYQKLLPAFDHLPEDRQRVWAYYGLYPNQVIVLYPEMVEFYQTIPLDAGRTILRSRTYGLPDARREVRAVRYLNERINGSVAREDERYFSWLGDALRSSVFPRNRLSTIEAGVASFHEQVRRALPIARREIEPSDEEIRRHLR